MDKKEKSLFKYGLEYISQCLLNHTDKYHINIFIFFIYLGHASTYISHAVIYK
jgi:hypothetical protein